MSPARPPVGAHSLPEGPGRRPEGAQVSPARPPVGAHSLPEGPGRRPEGAPGGFLLWQRGQLGIGSGRQVFRATEVPLLRGACELVDRLEALWQSEAARVEAAFEAAREQGRVEGEAHAREVAQLRLAEQLARLHQQAESAREQARGEVAALALQVVRKLLGSVPEPERQAALALQAARELLPARTWRLAVHPRSVAALREGLARLPDEGGSLAQAQLCEDDSLAPGDCRLDTEFGSARAGLEAQLERLASAWGVPGLATGSGVHR